MDTDIGPPLSAPRSHTGSLPCRKYERLTDRRETQHILTPVEKGIPLFSLWHPLILTLWPVSPVFSDISQADPQAPAA